MEATGAVSYLGVPLLDLDGRILGHLAVLDTRPMPEEPRSLALFKIFAARAAAELQRLRVESELRVKNDRLERLLNELKAAQTQLVQSEKMAAIGQLTAGIAHEINSPIGVIRSNFETARRCTAKLEEILEKAKEIAKNSQYQKFLGILKDNSQVSTIASDRIANIVSSLKNFTRLDEAEFARVNIHEGLDSTLTLIQHEIKDGIDVVKEYAELPEVHCCPSEINQVFMTLLRNAVQAIDNEGRVIVRTSTEKTNVSVQFSDTGKGISPENLKTLFDFGFTTKGRRVAMGMGLASAHNIIQDHKGELKVESEVGKGSTFTILLPSGLENTGETT